MNYSVRKLWLYLILALGVVNVATGITGILVKGVEFVFFTPIVIGIVFIFQYVSFSRFGYVAIHDGILTINNGLKKMKIQLSEIDKIRTKSSSISIALKGSRRVFIGLHLIDPEMREDLVKQLLDSEDNFYPLNNIN